MSLLCAFEAAARHQNFTAAALELHLTQSVISRQIRLLEEQLGAPLFVREKQTVRLTVAGEAYAREIREALRKIATATLGLRAAPGGGTLNLAAPPTFGGMWLGSRLGDFIKKYPEITVNLFTRTSSFDFSTEIFDAAVCFGIPDWPGTERQLIARERTIPVCAPSLASSYDFSEASDLLNAPLLHLVSRPNAWERWFNGQGVDALNVHGMLCDQYFIIFQIALTGTGIGLLPEIMVHDALESGSLVQIGDALDTQDDEAYYLVWPCHRTHYGPLAHFRAWLTEWEESVSNTPLPSFRNRRRT
ncbi:LysR substrate-binding domain-containing protein [Acetobacter conturbans]|uniref:LysR substrate-binding domain-containing protein n=1 Tax=Acetobacter conturbans TaxID=1737472 RepID=UPI0030D3A525